MLDTDESDPRERLEESFTSPYDLDDEVWSALLDVFAAEYEELESALEEVLDQRFVATATGEQLDMIGDLFGMDRRTDESFADFRARVQTGLRRQITSGTIPEIIETLAVLMDVDEDEIQISEPEGETLTFEARIPATALIDSEVSRELMPKLLDEISAVGVNGRSVSFTFVGTGVFVTIGDPVEKKTTNIEGLSSSELNSLSGDWWVPGAYDSRTLNAGLFAISADGIENRTIGPVTGTVTIRGDDAGIATTNSEGLSSSELAALSENDWTL